MTLTASLDSVVKPPQIHLDALAETQIFHCCQSLFRSFLFGHVRVPAASTGIRSLLQYMKLFLYNKNPDFDAVQGQHCILRANLVDEVQVVCERGLGQCRKVPTIYMAHHNSQLLTDDHQGL